MAHRMPRMDPQVFQEFVRPPEPQPVGKVAFLSTEEVAIPGSVAEVVIEFRRKCEISSP